MNGIYLNVKPNEKITATILSTLFLTGDRNTRNHIAYHGYISSLKGAYKKATNIRKELSINSLFVLISSFLNLFQNMYIREGINKIVENLIKIDTRNKNVPVKYFLFKKRKNEKRAKNIITISLCPLTSVSIITNGFKPKKIKDSVFLNFFQIKKSVNR